MKKRDARIEYEHGFYTIKLYSLLSDKGISINKLMRDTETDYSTFRRYANGSIQRIDLALIDKWCHYLECCVTDIIEYTQNDSEKNKNTVIF